MNSFVSYRCAHLWLYSSGSQPFKAEGQLFLKKGRKGHFLENGNRGSGGRKSPSRVQGRSPGGGLGAKPPRSWSSLCILSLHSNRHFCCYFVNIYNLKLSTVTKTLQRKSRDSIQRHSSLKEVIIINQKMAQVRIINNNWYNNIIGKYVENLFSYYRNIIKLTTFKHLQLFDQKRQQLQIVHANQQSKHSFTSGCKNWKCY